VKTCILVKYRKYRISALIDTGSDVSIAGEDVAWKFGWRIEDHETKMVHVANNEPVAVIGATYVTLRVGDRSVDSEILITPDLKGLILRIDWLTKQGRFNWDFDRGRIKFGDEDWIELQRQRVVHNQRGKFGRRRRSTSSSLSRNREREYTPDRMCIRQMSSFHTRLRKSREDTSVLVGESRYPSPEQDLKIRVFLYYQLLSRGKSRKVHNRVLKGFRGDRYLPSSPLFGSSLSKHQHSGETYDAEDLVRRKVRLEPKKPKVFVGESPQSWFDRPESVAGEQQEVVRSQTHVGEESEHSAMEEAEEVNSESVRDESVLRETEEVASREAEDVVFGYVEEAGEDLDGHGLLLPSRDPPVNPSPRSQSWRSWGNRVEAELGDEVG